MAAPLMASTTDPPSDQLCAAGGGVDAGGVGELGVLPPPQAPRQSNASIGRAARVPVIMDSLSD
jgi:hypothetical protein